MRPHDLSFLEQDGVRDDQFIPENEIEGLVLNALRGEKDFGEETLSSLKSEWTTIEKPFFLRRQ